MILGLLVCYTFVPRVASAQLTAPREAAQIELGPLSLYPSLQIIDAGKDSNVFNDGSAPREDYTFTLASRALAVVRFGANEALFSTGSDYVWFKEFAQERSSNEDYAVRFNLSASRLKPYVGALWSQTRKRPSFEIDARALRLERALLAGLRFNLTERTSIIAAARSDDTSYEEGQRFRDTDLGVSLNRTGKFFSGGVRYALTPLTTLDVTGDYSEDIFPDSHIRDSKTYSVVPLLEFSPDAAIRGRLQGGYQIFKPADPSLPEYRGGVLSAAVNWALFNGTTFDLVGTRNVSYSYQDGEPYYLLNGVRLTVDQRLFGPLDIHGGIDWEHLSYDWRKGVATVAGTADRVDTTTQVRGGVRVNVRSGLKVVITAEHTNRKSNEDPRQNFTRTRLLTSVTIGS